MTVHAMAIAPSSTARSAAPVTQAAVNSGQQILDYYVFMVGALDSLLTEYQRRR
ncbi:hypothetical protein ACQPZJ_30295 [Actinoplanes sp. CA-054009]